MNGVAFSPHAVSAIALSSDGARLATVCDQNCSSLLVTSLPPVTKPYLSLKPSSNSLRAEGAAFTALAWDGNHTVYTADERGSLASYSFQPNVKLDRILHIAAAHSGHSLTGVAVSPSIVATTGKDGLVKAWDPQRATCIARLKGHKGEARAVAVGVAGELHLLASAGRDRTVRLWDVRVGAAGMPVGVLSGHQGWVHDVALCAGNRPRVVSCAGDKTVRVWDLSMQRIEAIKSGHEFRVWSVGVDPLGSFAISGSTDTTVRYWNLDDDDGNAVWEQHQDSVLAVAVARDASFAVSASENGTVVMWDVKQMIKPKDQVDDASALHEINMEPTPVNQLYQAGLQSPRADAVHKLNVQSSSPSQQSRKPSPPLVQLSPTSKVNRTSPYKTPRHVEPNVVPIWMQNSSELARKNMTHSSVTPPRETRPPPNPVPSPPPRELRPQIFHSPTLSNPVSHSSPTAQTHSLTPSHQYRSSMTQYEASPSNLPSTPPPPTLLPPRPNGRVRSPSSDREAHSSPTSPDSSPRRRKLEDETNARIRMLEQMVAQRDKHLVVKDKKLQELQIAIVQRDRELKLLQKQVESAENLAKQANVRALAAEASMTDTNRGDEKIGDGPVDYTESIDRISRVTGKLKQLAAKLDGMSIV